MARSATFSPVMVSLLGIGVAAGAAASFVVTSTIPYASSTPVDTAMSPTVLGIILLAPLLSGLAWFIFRRITGGSPSMMSKGVIGGILLFFAVMVVLGVLAGAFGSHSEFSFSGSGGLGGGGTGGGGNHTNNSTAPPPGGLGPVSFQVFTLPGWVVLVAVVAIGLAVVGLAIPSFTDWSARRRARRNAPPTDAQRAAAGAALTQALSDLDRGADPRQVIERLYNRFLERVVPLSGDLASRTPEEIRADVLLPLGVRPDAAGQLTRAFEEARYSSHPMNVTRAAGVREAVHLAATDLTRWSPAP